MVKNIVILGSTGSIGKGTLDVIKKNSAEFSVLGLTGYSNLSLLEQQVRQWNPKVIAVPSEAEKQHIKKRIKSKLLTILVGREGLCRIASWPGTDVVVSALVGAAGLEPTLAAIHARHNIALANKEVLVMAGSIIMEEARRYKVTIFPIDSEHSAIWQCLKNENVNHIARIILTASGGPFREFSHGQLQKVDRKKTLEHPTWKMGKKVTVDSATLMNKGFEVIEAHHLFNVPLAKIDVVIHPESIIHSFVEFVDGSILAQLSGQDMRLPIQYALTYPDRKPSCLQSISLPDIARLTFQKPDLHRFPCLSYAYKAAKIGGTMPAVLSAADEIVVENFLQDKVSYVQIAKILDQVMKKHKVITDPTLGTIFSAASWAKARARDLC